MRENRIDWRRCLAAIAICLQLWLAGFASIPLAAAAASTSDSHACCKRAGAAARKAHCCKKQKGETGARIAAAPQCGQQCQVAVVPASASAHRAAAAQNALEAAPPPFHSATIFARRQSNTGSMAFFTERFPRPPPALSLRASL